MKWVSLQHKKYINNTILKWNIQVINSKFPFSTFKNSKKFLFVSSSWKSKGTCMPQRQKNTAERWTEQQQNNRLGDSMNEKLLLLIPRLTVEYKGQKRAYQQCRIKMFTVPLSHVQRRWNLMPTRWRLGMRASDPYPRPRYREEWRTRDKREIKYSDLEIHRFSLRGYN